MAVNPKQSARTTPGKIYRPLFLDRSGDLRPSVERELTSISQSFLVLADNFKNFPQDKDGYYVYPTGGGGTSGVASFKGRTGVVVPVAGDYTADMVTGALTKTAADALYQPKGSSGGSGDVTKAGNNTFTGENIFNTKPVTISIAGTLDTHAVNKGQMDAAIAAHTISLTPATTTTLGGIIVGDNLTIDSNGKLNATGGGSSTIVTEQVDLSYIGETKWHNHSVPVPDYAVQQDGQLLKRSDYPDLWSKIESGEITSIDDATWVSTVTARGNFSKGTVTTGTDANFRVPDLNGKQVDSIKGLFVRGSEREDPNAGGLGVIRQNASPNIYGGIDGNTDYGNPTGTVATNPFTTGNVASATMSSTTGGTAAHALSFNASRSSASYGRNSATEVRPNSISGIWILIAKKPVLDVVVIDSFVGAVQWFNGNRTKTPDTYLNADGQIVNRADHPELWALIEDGTFTSVTDALWLEDTNAAVGDIARYYQRGKYSTGDGTTTFRMPDLNGVQPNSIKGLFLRGDGGESDGSSGFGGATGALRASAAPEINGQFTTTVDGKFHLPTGAHTGSFSSLAEDNNVLASLHDGNYTDGVPFYTLGTHSRGAIFTASKSNIAYGRNGTNEVRPNSAKGVWVIKSKSSKLSVQLGGSGGTGDAYTKAESDAKFDLKADKATTYTKVESDAALNLKADKATTYTKTEADAKFALIGSGGGTPANMVTTDTTQTITGDKVFTGGATFDGLNSFGNIVAEGAALVDFSGADSVTVPEPTSDSHATTKKYVDDKVAAIGAGGGITIPETLTNMDASDALSTGWYWTDYRTTPSMTIVPNNYGDFAIVNHVVAKQATDNKGFCYQTMFVGGEHFTDIGGTKTMFFRVSPDGVATHWGGWQKIQDQSAAIAKAQADATKAIDYNHWYLGDDPKVLEYVDWLDAQTTASSLKRAAVKIGPNSLHLKGIIYKTMAPGLAAPNLFSIKKPLPGFTGLRKSYHPMLMDGNPGIHFTDYTGETAVTTFPVNVHSAQAVGTTQAGWIMFDEVITFE